MPQTCTVCKHENLEAVNQALLNGVSLRDIAGQFGLSRSALQRHKDEHIPAAMARAKEASDIAQADGLVAELRNIQRTALSILEQSYDSGDHKSALTAIRVARENIELLGKLLGELQSQPQTNILITSPDWLQLRAAVIGALGPYPEARQAVLEAINASAGE
jgi:hypothetical protein